MGQGTELVLADRLVDISLGKEPGRSRREDATPQERRSICCPTEPFFMIIQSLSSL